MFKWLKRLFNKSKQDSMIERRSYDRSKILDKCPYGKEHYCNIDNCSTIRQIIEERNKKQQ